MIVFFPEPYPDELVYSLLARYYVKAGYLAFQYAVEDLYIHKYTNPDVEFLNELKPEFLDVIKECCGMEALIQKHTMFPSYGTGLPFSSLTSFKDWDLIDEGQMIWIPDSPFLT